MRMRKNQKKYNPENPGETATVLLNSQQRGGPEHTTQRSDQTFSSKSSVKPKRPNKPDARAFIPLRLWLCIRAQHRAR